MPIYEGKPDSRGVAHRMIDHEREREEYRRHMLGIWGGPKGFASADFAQKPVSPEPPKDQVLPVIRMDWMSRPLEEQIDRIIQNGNVTIVMWKDGTKTVVKKAADEEYNLYAAVAQAVMKKLMGSTSHAHKVIAKKLVVQKPKEKKVKVLVSANLDNIQEAEIENYEGEANEAND